MADIPLQDNNAAAALRRLLNIMRRLRDPQSGCPWDRAQDFGTIAPYTLEEAYEVLDAIEREHYDDLCDELGDLLFQVVFHARMAEERDLFAFVDVANSISDKLERRHPHVFGDVEIADAETQTLAWEAHKQAERHQSGRSGILAGVPRALPALTRAIKLQRRAARVGLDWTDCDGVMAKLQEELAELQAARAGNDAGALRAEVGDLLFTCVNLARHLDIDAESALRDANAKFERRVDYIESKADLAVENLDAPALDRLWDAAKRAGL